MTFEQLFRDAIAWAAVYANAAHSTEDWDRIADAKARDFARLASLVRVMDLPQENKQ